MRRNVWLLIALAIAAIIVFLFRIYLPRQDCAFSGWKKSAGVGLEAAVRDLNAVKVKVGVSDAQVREFDSLMIEYALKYNAACRDFRANRMTSDEYACVRRNMDQVLDDVRRLLQAIKAAEAVSDASAQKEIISKSLDDMQAASRAQYRSGCTSAMNVSSSVRTFRF